MLYIDNEESIENGLGYRKKCVCVKEGKVLIAQENGIRLSTKSTVYLGGIKMNSITIHLLTHSVPCN